MTRVTLVAVLMFGAIYSSSEQVEKVALAGAWLQSDVKWTNAPAEINARLQSGEATVLYFRPDHSFALINCVVNRVPIEYMTISHGDGQVVYLGRWAAAGDQITVTYRLVSRTVEIKSEKVPGPFKRGTIKTSHAVLNMSARRYHRSKAVDESAAEVVNGAE